jgi:hypothetical protein
MAPAPRASVFGKIEIESPEKRKYYQQGVRILKILLSLSLIVYDDQKNVLKRLKRGFVNRVLPSLSWGNSRVPLGGNLLVSVSLSL